MEVKQWTYEEIPEFTQIPEGAEVIPTTGDEMGVFYMHDVEYANFDGVPLRLQILRPSCRNDHFNPFAPGPSVRRPCYVYVPGSAWFQQYTYASVPELAKMAARGYICVAVEYRHSGIAYFPAQARDARNAIRFLRANADRFGIDPDRMILAGNSSGGHTAMWGAMLQDDDDRFYPGVSAKVCGVVDFYGSTSVIAPDSNPSTVNHCLPDSPEGRVMGNKDLLAEPELARQLSVECNIDENTPLPPVLIFHGTKDRVVNCTGSAILYERLRETGHQAELYLLQGADHGGAEFSTDRVLDIVDDFCRRCFE